ncbi:glycosyltransferase [Mucilaginibacter sp. UR6-11]|uniref:glycosyltransferase family 2 protein n=1 Tax=Mucilaginibacter sp. UR6-11 TaxID=1435644 RepID=UPI001E2A6B2E|nr:glycosyltransferase [Mucilaginibacter sp. UR6-11]MCC8424856.1 glycosyltransferase [Mucilaginibacter sp. UR6-11]
MFLSIIIAAYNVEDFIEKCIRSCYVQNISTLLFEIIVVNDGSTDSTTKIVNELKADITNLVLVDQPNLGLGAARNTGIDHASGEYIWLIDGDDFITENILDEITNDIKVKQLDVMLLNYAITDLHYTHIKTVYHDDFLGEDIITGGQYYKRHYDKSYSWQFIFRKDIFQKNGLTFKEKINMQDSEILPKIMNHVNRLAFFNKSSYYYVQQPNSFTNSSDGEKRYRYFQSIIVVKESLINSLSIDNNDLKHGIVKKIKSLDDVVFNHLVFFKYDKLIFSKIVSLLKDNGFYPLQYDAEGKMKLIKWGFNHHPLITKKLIDKIQNLKITLNKS